MKYVLFLIFLAFPLHIFAQEMSSPQYKIELEQVEASSSAKTEQLNILQQKHFNENGYIISPPKEDFIQLNISDTVLNLPNLSSDQAQIHSILSSVSSSKLFGYQLIMIPLQGLESTNGEQIEPTSCDGKSQTCTITSAREWQSNAHFGWGYSVTGPDSLSDFINENYYRPFKTGESVVVSNSYAAKSERSTEMRFKVVIPPDLSEGNYSSIIKIFALPTL